MSLRFDDAARALDLSVLDLVQAAPPSGHLVLDVAQTTAARLAAGRRVHLDAQARAAAEHERYQAEVGVRVELEVDGWQVRLFGRLDGLLEEDGHTVVEEYKSTGLDAARLFRTSLPDFPAWTEQLAVYLWMLHRNRRPAPEGRLVIVSLLDAARHVLGVRLDAEGTEALVLTRVAGLVRDREARLAHLKRRRAWTVPWPHGAWRDGQRRIAHAVHAHLDDGQRLLVQAPTGLGKTAAVLHGALQHALRADRRVHWATSRNTQHAGVEAELARLRAAGLPLTSVTLQARERVCLNDVVACRPDTCRFADGYYDRREARDVLPEALAGGINDSAALRALGERHTLCPAQLASDLARRVDVVIGDMNYALVPGQTPTAVGPDGPGELVVIADEAHQVVERVRDHLSPSLSAAAARTASTWLRRLPGAEAMLELAQDIGDLVADVADATPGAEDEVEGALMLPPWRALAARVDGLAFDYALLKARAGLAGVVDPWLDLARATLRVVAVAETADEGVHTLVRRTRGDERVRLFCVDPSAALTPHLEALGGFIGCSATLDPPDFHRDLLGLPATTGHLAVPSPFDPSNRLTVVVPEVRTRWRHRATHAAPTAATIAALLDAVPGHAVLFFSSFDMLNDLTERLPRDRHELLVQRPGMSEPERSAWIERLAVPNPPVVLAAVLGGIFAEGIDPPPGSLDAVFVVGPGLPPVGLERKLLQAHHERRFGHGFLYAFVVPGVTRVVQAAGRLHRRPQDRGAVVLLDERFAQRPYSGLLAPLDPTTPSDPQDALRAFFARGSA